MSTSLQTNFEGVRNAYAPVFDALERALQKFDIDFYLIGAQSRDVWTNHLKIQKRITRDIDYSVLIGDRGTWSELNKYLIETEKFERDKKQPYRFYLRGFTIDLIPFGGIDQNDHVILDDPRTEISVYGYREVTEEAVIINDKYRVVTLPGLCILKLIAYNEKPEWRMKDWQDFLIIMSSYDEIAGEKLFEGDYDDLIDGDFEYNIASARMLGRHMAVILKKNEQMRNHIVEVLTGKLMKQSIADIDEMYPERDRDDTQLVTLKLIVEVIKGIND